MGTILSILAAVDGDMVPCRAMETGCELADKNDEELVTLHVMTQEKYDDLHETMDSGKRADGA